MVVFAAVALSVLNVLASPFASTLRPAGPWHSSPSPASAAVYSLSVVPLLSTSSTQVFSSGTANYTVSNTSTGTSQPLTVSFSVVGCIGSINNCTMLQPVMLFPGQSTTVWVTFNGGYTTSSPQPLVLSATANAPDATSPSSSAIVGVSVIPQGPAVTAISVTPSPNTSSTPSGTSSTATYIVRNASTGQPPNSALLISFAIAGCPSPTISCGQAPPPISLTQGGAQLIAINYTGMQATSSPVSLTLTASAGPATNSGTVNVTVTGAPGAPAYAITVTAAPAASSAQMGSQGTATYTVQNTSTNTAGPLQIDFGVAGCSGSIVCMMPPGSISLMQGSSQNVSVIYNAMQVTTTPVAVALTGTAFAPSGPLSRSDTVRVSVTGPPPPPPIIYAGAPTYSPVTVAQGGSGLMSFSVSNNAPAGQTVVYSVNCGGVGSCSAWPDSQTLGANSSSTGWIYFTAGPTQSGTYTIALTATGPGGSNTATGLVTVQGPAPVYAISVTPNPSSASAQLGAMGFASYTIRNTSTNSTIALPISFVVSGCTSNIAPCGAAPSTITLAQGASQGVSLSFYGAAVTSSAALSLTGSTGYTSPSTGTVSVSVTQPAPVYAIAVTPNPATSSTPQGTSGIAYYTVTNTSTNSTISLPVTFSVSGCAGYISSCATPSSITLAQGASQNVPVGYYGAAVTSSPVALSLTASTSYTSPYTQSVNVSVTPPVAPATVIAATLVGPFPDGAITRDACLTISAGAGAAYECGALRMVHQLPSTRTFNKTRAPTLLFQSDHAAPGTILAVDVAVTGTSIPTSIDATVTLGGRAATRSFPWNAAWSNGQPRRIAIPIDAAALSLTNGNNAVLLAATVEVKAIANGSALATATRYGTVAIVDRRSSPFGAGWWLDGLEQFVSVDPTHKLWVGGDGSTRVYTQQGTSNVWLVTPTVSRPETLEYFPGTFVWRRQLPNGAYVEFDNAGIHRQTRDALGRFTTFTYTTVVGRQVLASIQLPVPSGTQAPSYAFGYATDASGTHLNTITSPYIGGSTRSTFVSQTNGWMTRVTDADARHVDFAYDGSPSSGTRHLIARINRLGDSTFFAYDEAGLLHSSKLDMRRTGGPGAAYATQTFCPAESRSIAVCSVQNPASDLQPQSRALVYTLYDGPRAGNADTAHFEVTPYGAPSRIVSALGGVTTITRADTRWPVLVTEVADPRGHIVRASYDGRAHLATATDVNPDSAGAANQNATTTYQWDATWDRVTRVSSPTGIRSASTYDPASGDRLTDSLGGVLRAAYGYGAAHQLSSIVTPLSATPTQIFHDALGNVQRTVTSKGFTTWSYRDGIGRDSVTRTPVDTAAGRWRYGVVTHDIMDRVVAQVDSAGATTASDFQATRIETQFDAEGQLLSLIRRAIPDNASLGDIETRYTYDEAGNRLTETDPYAAGGSQTAQWIYDLAGNVLQHDNKAWPKTVAMQYDVMNRLVSRILSSTVTRYSGVALRDTFEYDIVGNLRSARNQFAEVGRGYTLAGRLTADTLRIKAADLVSSGMSHEYVLTNGYDLEGRRTWQRQPANLTPAAGALVQYGYDLSTGELADVQDVAGNHFGTLYNAAGLPRALTKPGGIAEVLTYDDDGRLYHRLEQGISKTIHDEARVLDERGKITSVTDAGDVHPVTGSFTFTGLGAALYAQTNGDALETRRFTVDALGDVLRERRTIVLDGGKRSTPNFTYQPHSTRLVQAAGPFTSIDERSGSSVSGTSTLAHTYDGDGRLVHSSYDELSPGIFGGYTIKQATWSSDFVFNALGQLMGADHHTVNDNEDWSFTQTYRPSATALATGKGGYEEYRYDPLGRRIWKRAHRDGYCTVQQQLNTTDCLGFVTRTVWDGDQVLYEIRAPGGDAVLAADLERDDGNSSSSAYPLSLLGRVMYVHGADVDQPLELVRSGTEYHVLHLSQRGLVDVTTDPAGSYSTCGGPGPVSSLCADVTWPGMVSNYYHARSTYQFGPRTWYGDMVQSFQDASGLQYRRNRYYDPSTGRFTQEDPIGIAGGINLYGFGGGDLVNFADPFGLCPDPISCALTLVTGSGAIVSSAGSLAATTVGAVASGIGGAATAAVYSVYTSITEGKSYVGMTKDIVRRGREHLRGPHGMSIQSILGGLIKAEARGVEQVLIEARGLKKNGGDLLNQINSISPAREDYENLKAQGREILKSIGYGPMNQ